MSKAIRENPADISEDTYGRLKEAIREGIFKVGDRLTETDVAERLGVSRTPVREAIHRLEAEGMLTYKPRRGITVTKPDQLMVMELYVMREALEGTAARLAAQHASDLEIEALAELIESEAAHFGAGAQLSRINTRIHRVIHMAAHNRYLLRNLSSLTDTMSLLPTMLADEGRAREAHAEHVRIIQAIQARNPEQAEHAAKAHMKSAMNHRLKWLIWKDEAEANPEA